jgi:hypothetical protein
MSFLLLHTPISPIQTNFRPRSFCLLFLLVFLNLFSFISAGVSKISTFDTYIGKGGHWAFTFTAPEELISSSHTFQLGVPNSTGRTPEYCSLLREIDRTVDLFSPTDEISDGPCYLLQEGSSFLNKQIDLVELQAGTPIGYFIPSTYDACMNSQWYGDWSIWGMMAPLVVLQPEAEIVCLVFLQKSDQTEPDSVYLTHGLLTAREHMIIPMTYQPVYIYPIFDYEAHYKGMLSLSPSTRTDLISIVISTSTTGSKDVLITPHSTNSHLKSIIKFDSSFYTFGSSPSSTHGFYCVSEDDITYNPDLKTQGSLLEPKFVKYTISDSAKKYGRVHFDGSNSSLKIHMLYNQYQQDPKIHCLIAVTSPLQGSTYHVYAGPPNSFVPMKSNTIYMLPLKNYSIIRDTYVEYINSSVELPDGFPSEQIRIERLNLGQNDNIDWSMPKDPAETSQEDEVIENVPIVLKASYPFWFPEKSTPHTIFRFFLSGITPLSPTQVLSAKYSINNYKNGDIFVWNNGKNKFYHSQFQNSNSFLPFDYFPATFPPSRFLSSNISTHYGRAQLVNYHDASPLLQRNSFNSAFIEANYHILSDDFHWLLSYSDPVTTPLTPFSYDVINFSPVTAPPLPLVTTSQYNHTHIKVDILHDRTPNAALQFCFAHANHETLYTFSRLSSSLRPPTQYKECFPMILQPISTMSDLDVKITPHSFSTFDLSSYPRFEIMHSTRKLINAMVRTSVLGGNTIDLIDTDGVFDEDHNLAKEEEKEEKKRGFKALDEKYLDEIMSILTPKTKIPNLHFPTSTPPSPDCSINKSPFSSLEDSTTTLPPSPHPTEGQVLRGLQYDSTYIPDPRDSVGPQQLNYAHKMNVATIISFPSSPAGVTSLHVAFGFNTPVDAVNISPVCRVKLRNGIYKPISRPNKGNYDDLAHENQPNEGKKGLFEFEFLKYSQKYKDVLKSAPNRYSNTTTATDSDDIRHKMGLYEHELVLSRIYNDFGNFFFQTDNFTLPVQTHIEAYLNTTGLTKPYNIIPSVNNQTDGASDQNGYEEVDQNDKLLIHKKTAEYLISAYSTHLSVSCDIFFNNYQAISPGAALTMYTRLANNVKWNKRVYNLQSKSPTTPFEPNVVSYDRFFKNDSKNNKNLVMYLVNTLREPSTREDFKNTIDEIIQIMTTVPVKHKVKVVNPVTTEVTYETISTPIFNKAPQDDPDSTFLSYDQIFFVSNHPLTHFGDFIDLNNRIGAIGGAGAFKYPYHSNLVSKLVKTGSNLFLMFNLTDTTIGIQHNIDLSIPENHFLATKTGPSFVHYDNVYLQYVNRLAYPLPDNFIVPYQYYQECSIAAWLTMDTIETIEIRRFVHQSHLWWVPLTLNGKTNVEIFEILGFEKKDVGETADIGDSGDAMDIIDDIDPNENHEFVGFIFNTRLGTRKYKRKAFSGQELSQSPNDRVIFSIHPFNHALCGPSPFLTPLIPTQKSNSKPNRNQFVSHQTLQTLQTPSAPLTNTTDILPIQHCDLHSQCRAGICYENKCFSLNAYQTFQRDCLFKKMSTFFPQQLPLLALSDYVLYDVVPEDILRKFNIDNDADIRTITGASGTYSSEAFTKNSQTGDQFAYVRNKFMSSSQSNNFETKKSSKLNNIDLSVYFDNLPFLPTVVSSTTFFRMSHFVGLFILLTAFF